MSAQSSTPWLSWTIDEVVDEGYGKLRKTRTKSDSPPASKPGAEGADCLE
jgi:hypothetical protein